MVFETVTQFKKMLQNMDAIMVKAAAYADHKKFDVNVLAQARLAPDMYPFVKQIQACCDSAKFCAAYLSEQTAPKHEDNEATWTELRERLKKVVTYLDTFGPESFTKAATVKVSPKWAEGKWILGKEFVETVAVPNFYFHVMAAYAILRHSGVDIGKMDYLGSVNFKK